MEKDLSNAIIGDAKVTSYPSWIANPDPIFASSTDSLRAREIALEKAENLLSMEDLPYTIDHLLEVANKIYNWIYGITTPANNQ